MSARPSGPVAHDGSVPDPATRRLADLGWRADLEDHFARWAADGCLPGRVARVDRGLATVQTGDGPLRVPLSRRAAPPAVGDWIAVRLASDGTAEVAAVLPRRSAFVRHGAGETTSEQVLAANVDTVLLVNALNTRLNLRRIERYLALGWQSGASPVVVLTKADLCDDVPAAVAAVEVVALGVPVHAVSTVTGDGMDAVARYARPGATLALLGLSGVGKSTLANHLAGRALLRVSDVRADGKGRHTTTHRELVVLPRGGVLIDTPGMRGLLLWDSAEGVEQSYPDVEELAASCRFADCAHASEPGCAVRAALRDGRLPVARLESYRKLQRELRFLEIKQDARARSDERRRYRAMNRQLRQQARGG